MLKKIVLGAGLIAATAFSSLSSAQTVLRFSNWLPPTHPITTQILQHWAADIEKNSDGRIKIQFLPALGKPPAHFDLVRDGVVELSGRIRAGSQITLRGIFSKTFSKDRVWPIVPDSLAADSRLAGLEITQLLMENGWVALAIGPERPKPSVAERTRTATK